MGSGLNAERVRQLAGNRFLLFWYMLFRMPLGAFAGLRCERIDDDICEVSLPGGWRTRNPFRSTYWAAQGMAAELATAIIPLSQAKGADVAIRTLVTGCRASFRRQGRGRLIFRCEDFAAMKAGMNRAAVGTEGVECSSRVIGFDQDGEVVSEWIFDWNFKAKSVAAT